MPETKVLLWCDLETTGTDEDSCDIIEVGVVLTQPDLTIIDADKRVCAPIRHLPPQWDPFVRNMHQSNGLLRAIGETQATIREVDLDVAGWLDRWGERLRFGHNEVLLAGSGVSHFDRRFIRAQMPRVERWLAYPNLDVGVVRRLLWTLGFEDLVPELNEAKTHRAFDDVMLHLKEAREYEQMFRDARLGAALRALQALGGDESGVVVPVADLMPEGG